MEVIKRNGKRVPFDTGKIILAIEKAMEETKIGMDSDLSLQIAEGIKADLEYENIDATVEYIQNKVESYLMKSDREDVAKAYILYRANRNKVRGTMEYELLDDEFISKYKKLPSPMTPLGEFTYLRTYSRWLPAENRREYWWETVRRAVEFNCKLGHATKAEAQQLYDNVFHLRQFLSGRTFWIGNTDISREYGTSNYNCAFLIINAFSKFKELFYLLMVGTGGGFRVLPEDVAQLPPIRTNVEVIHKPYFPISKGDREDNTSVEFINQVALIKIGDSKEGWTQALDWYFRIRYEHEYKKVTSIILDYDNVRPRGEKLLRFGGTASGHESLKNMFQKISVVLSDLGEEAGKDLCKLRPIHCLDICNIIGENVVVGGVRRTSEVGLISEMDEECITAKSKLYIEKDGKWVLNEKIGHRRMSNNSIYYRTKPSREKLHWHMQEMRYSGDPAFMNAVAGRKRRPDLEGGNPCMEILMRDRGLCNLTTNNCMAFVKNGELDWVALEQAQRLSVRAGLRMTLLELELYEWNNVQQEDRLLGCSLTGWQDMVNATGIDKYDEANVLSMLKRVAWNEALNYSKYLGVNLPRLITTIKPEGTLSLLPTVSSGVHYSHSPYYVRRVRINSDDPLVKVCEELGYPVYPETGQDWETCSTKVVEFPVQAPDGRTKYDVSAIEQLENYKMFMRYYVDHNCSITVTVRDHEWEQVEQWLWDNWDIAVAISFLSLDDSFHQLMPYEAITKEEYEYRVSKMRPFVPSLLSKYEIEEVELDIGASECVGGVCPVR